MARRRKEQEETRGEGFVRRTDKRPTKREISEANSRARRARAEVAKLRERESTLDVFFEGDGPHEIVFLSDVHFGSDTVDYDYLNRFIEYVEADPRRRVIGLGDMIEGSKPQYATTIEHHRTGDVTEEIRDFQQHVLERIGNRFIGTVGGFWGHTGWPHDSGGVNVWDAIFTEYEIPVLKNGSTVNVSYINQAGELIEKKVDVAHYLQGKSKFDSLHAQREHAKRKKGDEKPDATAQGHIHSNGWGIENYPDALKRILLIQSGTFKGINPDLPIDAFGEKAGFYSKPGDPGQGMIFLDDGTILPYLDLLSGEQLGAALNLLQNNPDISDEALTTARKHSKPVVKFRSRRSRTSIDSEHIPTEEEQLEMLKKEEDDELLQEAKDLYEKDEPLYREALEMAKDDSPEVDMTENGVVYSRSDLAPLYDTVSYNIRSDWPMLFLPIANVRMGSSYEGTETLRQMIDELIIDNPHVFVAFLGNVVDTDVSKQENRIDILDELANIINLIGSEQVLALLLDSSLRNANWRKDIGDHDYVPPGTYVSEKTGVPLVPGGSSIEIFHGPNTRADRNSRHSTMVMDGLRNHGSFSKALAGLNSYDYHHNHAGHDVLVSGHLPHAAVGSYEKDGRLVDLINVGWLSPYDNRSGKRNVQRTSPGGQSVTYMEGKRFLAADWQDTVRLFNALLAYAAARRFGMIDTK